MAWRRHQPRARRQPQSLGVRHRGRQPARLRYRQGVLGSVARAEERRAAGDGSSVWGQSGLGDELRVMSLMDGRGGVLPEQFAQFAPYRSSSASMEERANADIFSSAAVVRGFGDGYFSLSPGIGGEGRGEGMIVCAAVMRFRNAYLALHPTASEMVACT